MALTIKNNRIFGMLHPAVVGNHKILGDTPQGIIIGNGAVGGSTGKTPKYSGTDISNNFIGDMYSWGFGGPGYCSSAFGFRCRDAADCPVGDACNPFQGYYGRGSGLVLENAHIGTTNIHDNVFARVEGFVFEMDCNAPEGESLINFYNNVILDSTTHLSNGYCSIQVNSSGGNCLTNNVNIYNNLIKGSSSRPQLCWSDGGGGGTVTNFRVRNNIFYSASGARVIDWGKTDSTNLFENNDILIPSTLNCQ